MASLLPYSGLLGTKKAAHLLRRATMGPSVTDLNNFAQLTTSEAIELLFSTDPIPSHPIDITIGTDWIYPIQYDPDVFSNDLNYYTRFWFIDSLYTSGTNLTGRMFWFYYTHFPMILSRIENIPQFPIDYLRLLRHYALGNYKELTKAICIDNGMLLHLDGNLNVKGVPQENFAREFLELFTVGKGADQGNGNYTTFTEQDVQMATKVFTGWGIDPTFQTIDPITSLPTGKVKESNGNASQHDVTAKQFSGAFNNTVITTPNVSGTSVPVQSVIDELDAFIDMIFASPNTAKHICRRIYRQFVYFDITNEIEQDIIAPLATILMNNDYEIKSVLEVLLQSEHFYDLDVTQSADMNIGAIIKSPIEIIISTLRIFDLQLPDRATDVQDNYEIHSIFLDELSLQGLELFEPYDVAGHDPYFQFPDFHRYWISSNYLANRYKFTKDLLMGFSTEMNQPLVKLDIVEFVKTKCSNPSDATILMEELVAWILPITLDSSRFDYFKNTVLLDQLSAINWSMEWNNYISTNDDSSVRIQLEALASALMESPEYQLF